MKVLPKEVEGGEEGLKTCVNQNYDKCMYKALETRMLNEAGCRVPFIVPQLKEKTPICEEPMAANTSYWIAWTRVTNQLDDCVVPCKSLVVDVGGKNTRDNNKTYGEAYFYYAPRIATNEEEVLYTFLSMVAEIGGYVGLLLGFSIFHFIGWISDSINLRVRALEAEAVATSKNAVNPYEEKA